MSLTRRIGGRFAGRRWGLFVFIAVLATASVATAEVRKTTYTYKKVDNLEIKADVYRSDDDTVQPVLVWIHGGALIMGNREGIDRRFKSEFAGNGCILVSIDYRLAPETKLPEIIADVEDAFRWVREKGPQLFHADPNRIAVAGASAGGYLTLTAGFRVKPRPVALVPLFGYGSLVADWYAKPSTYPRHNPRKVERDEAYKQVSGKPIADDRDRMGNGGSFYLYCRQQGAWPQGVSGWDPIATPEKFYPYMAVKNVSSDYPPTFLIHGDKDTDVPHEESVAMAAELKKNNVEHRFVSIPNGEHGFGGADKEVVEQAYQDAFAFIREHLKSGR